MIADLSGKNILIIGMGSGGRRHALLAEKLGAYVAAVSRRPGVADYSNVEMAIKASTWDLVVIANETSAHINILKTLSEIGYRGKVLVEKPLFQNISDVDCDLNFDTVKIAYNMRFHPVIRHVKDWLSKREKVLVGASFHVGQDLSSWRPTRDVLSTYSANKSEGGGVLRDLSHELDLSLWLLGPVSRVTSLGGRVSDVTVDSDDFWNVLSVHDRCPNVTIHLNYLDQPAKRILKLWTKDDSLEVDFLTGRLQEGPDYVHLPLDPDQTYMAQLSAMFEDHVDLCSYGEGTSVLTYIDAIEMSALQENWIKIGDVS